MPEKVSGNNNKKLTSLPGKTSVKKGFARRFIRYSLYALSGLILLLIFLFLVAQTDTFNRWLLERTINYVNNSLASNQSVLNIRALEGNIFTGLRLIDGNITVKRDTMVKFDSLEVKYDIFSLLNEKIVLRKLTLNSPQINLIKVKAGGDTILWNFEYMLRSGKVKTDTIQKPFEWGIYAHEIVLYNANVRVLGKEPLDVPARKVKMGKLTVFDPEQLDIINLNADLEAVYSPELKMLRVKSLSFSTNSDFAVKKLNFLATSDLSDTTVQLRSLDLVTQRSKLTIGYLYMNHFNPFGRADYESFKNNEVKIHMSSESFNFKDLKYFVPQVEFMDGAAAFNLDADGKYGDLDLKRFLVKTQNSYLNVKGKIQNLDKPDKLYFDVTTQNSILDPSDASILLPGLQIPDLTTIGKVYANIRYTGEPSNFSTKFELKSSAGIAEGSFELDLTKVNPEYKTSFISQGLNLASIMKNKELESNLNVKADISGSGFDLNTISSKVNYELTNSKVYGIDIVKSSGSVEIFHKDVNADIVYQSEHLQTSLKGKINLDNPSGAEYIAKGEARNLDLSEYTKNHNDKSNLNFTFDVNGRGLNTETLSGTFDIDLADSYYASYQFPRTPIQVKLNNINRNGEIDMKTNYFDFHAKGKFDFANLADVLHQNLSVITDEIQRSTHELSAGERNTGHSKEYNKSDIDFTYEFKSKNLKPVVKIFDTSDIQLVGDVNGRITNSNSGFSSFTQLDVRDFMLPDSMLAVRGFSGSINFNNDYSKSAIQYESPLYSISSDVKIVCSNLNVAGSGYKNINAGMNLYNNDQSFYLNCGADSAFIVDVNGNTHYDMDKINLSLSRLFVRYNNFDIKNNENLLVDYTHSGKDQSFTFSQFNLSNNFMKLSASGKLSLTDSSDMDVEAKSINVAEILELLFPPDSLNKSRNIQYRSPVKGNIRRLSVYFKGTTANPDLSLEMNSDLLRYQTNKIGRIDAFLDYKNSTLSTDVLVSNATGNGRLRMTGDIPYANPLVKNDSAKYTDIASNPVDFKLVASNFQVSFFSKLIPHFAELRGILDGEIDSKGTIAKPVLTGEMSVTGGRFFFGLTGMYHRFTSKLRTENSDLVVDNFRIMNMEDETRHLDFWGRINFEGFTVKDINLSSSGDIAVMDKSSEDNDLGFYGNMIMGVGNPPVTIRGDLHKLYIEGQLLIKSANLRFQSVPTTAYDITYDNFIYKTLVDSSGKVFKDTIIVVTPETLPQVDPFLRSQVVSGNEAASSLTNFIYNLNIKTVNNAYVSIDFNDITQEQLFGEIKADLDMTNKATGNMQLFGNIYIVGDSYYRFYRNFKVKDSRIIFMGYPYNPTLDIHATYSTKQVTSDLTTSSTTENTVITLDITGTKRKPQLTLHLYENGAEVMGPDAQSDAISYLLFGVSKNTLMKGGQQSEVAKNIGTATSLNYLNSMFGSALKDIAPFILNTELNYTEGSVATGTDIRITSEIGNATVRFGGKILSGIGNAEVTLDYPLNKMLNINVSNNLILEVFRVIDDNSLSGLHSVLTGARLIYRIHY